jgi:hypothetical protein
MVDLRRFLSRRWLLAILGGAAAVFGLLMLHPWPRQSLFGPKIRGKPWCAWEMALHRNVHWDTYADSVGYKLHTWVGLDPVPTKDSEFEHADLAPLLVHLTSDYDPEIRDEAIRHLHVICPGNPQIFPQIAPLATHPDESVRVASMFMMMNFRDRSLPILTRALDDAAADVRFQAAYQLEHLGPSAATAIPALERRLDDDDDEVRKMAARAIQAIEPKRMERLKSGGKIR